MPGPKEAVDLLYSWVQLGGDGREELVTMVNKGLIRTVARNARKLLVEQEGGQMELRAFTKQVAGPGLCSVFVYWCICICICQDGPGGAPGEGSVTGEGILAL